MRCYDRCETRFFSWITTIVEMKYGFFIIMVNKKMFNIKHIKLITLTLWVAMGCAQDVGDVARLQPNRIQKPVFEGEWYLQRSTFDVPYSSGFTFTGETSELERALGHVSEDDYAWLQRQYMTHAAQVMKAMDREEEQEVDAWYRPVGDDDQDFTTWHTSKDTDSEKVAKAKKKFFSDFSTWSFPLCH